MSGAFRLGVIAASGRPGGGSDPGGGGDPHFAKVASLLHFEGADGSATFTDVTGRTWSIAKGAPQISTAQSVAGGSSLALDTTAALSASGFVIPAPSGTSGDFCIEFFLHFGPGNSGRSLLTLYDAVALRAFVYCSSSSTLSLNISGAGSSSGSIFTGWSHVAVTRSGTTVRMFIGGVQAGGNITTSFAATAGLLRLGEDANISGADNGFAGYVDELRVTIGEARYTGDFTPPAVPFPDF